MRGEILFASLAGTPLDAVSPAAASLQWLLGLGLSQTTAMTVVVSLGWWAAGLGGFALGKRHGLGVGALGLLGLQLAPAALRGLWAGEVAVWGLGPGALAMAGVLPWLFGALAAAFCWPLGLVVLASRWKCRWTWLTVVPVLLVQWLPSASPDAHSLRQGSPERRTVPAYVTTDGAVLPLPVPPPPEHSIQPRPHAGWVALVGLLCAMALGPRAVGGVGLALGAALVLGTGWLPAQGLPPPRVAEWWVELAPPGVGRGGSGWAVAVGLAGVAGLIELARRHLGLLGIAVAAVLAEALLSASLRAPVTVLPPDPALSTERGSTLVWPSPDAPWFQGTRSSAELDVLVGPRVQDAAWVAQLSAMDGLGVDAQSAEVIWSVRGERLEERGIDWLLLHRPEVRNSDALEGWLAGTVGAPVAVGEEWVLYRIE